ncbi:MAG: hypothetical protein AAF125_13580, partial [Chloroflexota bacterium]
FNECATDGRDPFDINNNGQLDNIEVDETRQLILDEGFELVDASTNEGRRGFALTGRWEREVGCAGSEWSIYRMERLVNLRGIGLDDEEMQQLPDQQALALVEIAWNHQLLLAVPGFSAMFDILGGEQGSYIYVWAAFPTPSAEFNMNLDQTLAPAP